MPGPLTVTLETTAGPTHVRVWPARAEYAARGPVLLALHGWTDDGGVFGPLAEALDRRWTLLAPDAPAHGGTPWRPAQEYLVGSQLGHAVAILDALPRVAGQRRAAVVLGHSMGALTAARVAAARPEAVRQLVLEDPAHTGRRPSRSAARWRAWLRDLRALSHEQLVARCAQENPTWPEDERDPWARSKEDLDLAHLDVPVDWGEPLAELLPEVRCPVLLVHGSAERGGIVTPTAARRCARACPAGCEVVRLDAGHNPRRDARVAYVTTLVSILSSHSAPVTAAAS